jgi:hypothetical protein
VGRIAAVVVLGACAATAACGDAFSSAGDDAGDDATTEDAQSDAPPADAVAHDTGGGDAPVDAGSDGKPAPPPCDASAPLSNGGTVQCVQQNAPCTQGEVCCYTSNVVATRCYTKGAVCNALRFACDKASDCDALEVCCMVGAATSGPTCPYEVPSASESHCIGRDAGCSNGQIELCTAAQTCLDSAKSCHPLEATVITSNGNFTRQLGGCF